MLPVARNRDMAGEAGNRAVPKVQLKIRALLAEKKGTSER